MDVQMELDEGKPRVLEAVPEPPMSEAEADRQWRAAWAHIAAGCAGGLTELNPQHPRRAELLGLTRDAHESAELPLVPRLRSA